MLNSATPYPHVGSFALIEVEGRTQLARILSRAIHGEVTISLPLRPGAAGTRHVPLDQLRDGTPLSAADREEKTKLERLRAPGRKSKERRAALRLRDRDSRLLRTMLHDAVVAGVVPRAATDPVELAA